MGTALAVLLVGALLAAAIGAYSGTVDSANETNKSIEEKLKEKYPDLTDYQIKSLIAQYGDDVPENILDFGAMSNSSDLEGLDKLMEDIQKAHELYGDAPKALTPEELAQIQEDAYNEIDAENQRLLDLYNQSFNNSQNQLQDELLENSAMFGDYRNQILTNEAMRQQALAGATRFELDRQQRNAITRGASAAQRLVANINTQLGLQAQSAQQSLDTSNALAQNLLAHRQAQQNVRNSYLNLQNQHNRDIASTISGQAERRYNYGQGRKQGAVEDYDYATKIWDENVNNSDLGEVGKGIYRKMYGNTSNNSL